MEHRRRITELEVGVDEDGAAVRPTGQRDSEVGGHHRRPGAALAREDDDQCRAAVVIAAGDHRRGRIGNGLGMIVRRGFKEPPSYHIDRLREAPVGHLYDVITNGYGAMLNYAAQVQPRDRWAIVAYIRALQYAENANINDLPQEARARIPAAGTAPTRAQQNEPLVSSDPDFSNFPAVPATPSGVPGVEGAGAAPSNQPERK